MRPERRRLLLVAFVAVVVLVAAAVFVRPVTFHSATGAASRAPGLNPAAGASGGADASGGYPGMPSVVDPSNIYSEISSDKVKPDVAGDLPRVYVPNGQSDTVSVIDPATHAVVSTFKTGPEPQHIVPSYDMRTL